MNLTEIEKKLLMLGMDKAATEDEMTVCAKKFLESMKKRFSSGVELIAALESGVGDAVTGERVYRTRAEAQAAADAMNRGPFPSFTRPFGRPDPDPFATQWQNIMREAQQFARAREAARAAERQQTWEEYCRQAQQQNPYWQQQQNVQQEEPPPTNDSWFQKVKKKLNIDD